MSSVALDSSVLVLNRSLVPVNLTTVKRAFCLICKDAAEIVDIADGRFEFYGFETWQEISEFKRESGIADGTPEVRSHHLPILDVGNLLYTFHSSNGNLDHSYKIRL